jgi:hypothetical protein
VSASRLGLSSALITSLGKDANGDDCLQHLTDDGVATEFIRQEEGKKTKLVPSLVLLIKSKAHLQINTPNNKAINEEDGIVFVEGAKNGKYSIKVVSDQTDDYTIYAGQIGKKDKWETIKGKIKPQNPASKVDTYTLDVDLDK